MTADQCTVDGYKVLLGKNMEYKLQKYSQRFTVHTRLYCLVYKEAIRHD